MRSGGFDFKGRSKIIRVETAEVDYLDVVNSPLDEGRATDWFLADNMDYYALTRAALEKGIAQTVSDLRRAFR